MKNIFYSVIFFTLLFTSYSETAYAQIPTKRDFVKQLVPENLYNKTWILEEISSKDLNYTKDKIKHSTKIEIQFYDGGILNIAYKDTLTGQVERNFMGGYLAKEDRFTYFNTGIDEKVKWNIKSDVSPNTIAWCLNKVIMDFETQKDLLILYLPKDSGYLVFRREAPSFASQ